MTRQLEIIGCLLILLALIHVFFPRYFQWKKELMGLSLINRQMFVVHTFFIALTVFLMGMLCLTSARELLETPLGRKISAGLAVFWTIRMFLQFFGYSSALWKGKVFETIIHVVFSGLWIYLSVTFWRVWFQR